jgi:hypothetical protein
MKRFQNPTWIAIAALLLVVTITGAADAQTYTVLDNLGTKNGDPLNPAWMGTVAQGRDGNLYSTRQGGGANAFGTVFQRRPPQCLEDELHCYLHMTTGTGACDVSKLTGGIYLPVVNDAVAIGVCDT